MSSIKYPNKEKQKLEADKEKFFKQWNKKLDKIDTQCEYCGKIGLTPETRAYAGFSGFMTICYECAEYITEELFYPVSYDTLTLKEEV